MNKKVVMMMLVACLLCCVIVYARHAKWEKTEKPVVSLREALNMAEAELKNETIEYFCIGASLANTFSGGDWELHFSSKEGKEMWFSIGSDKQVRKSEVEFQYK